MHGEYFLINNGGNGKTIETICKSFPQFDIVSSFAWEKERGERSAGGVGGGGDDFEMLRNTINSRRINSKLSNIADQGII